MTEVTSPSDKLRPRERRSEEREVPPLTSHVHIERACGRFVSFLFWKEGKKIMFD